MHAPSAESDRLNSTCSINSWSGDFVEGGIEPPKSPSHVGGIGGTAEQAAEKGLVWV
jgi:hypothetical protein